MSSREERLPVPVYSAAQVRALDRVAIETHGIAGYELMSRAGRAALDCLKQHWPDARDLDVYCGAGNNAGDGYVLARLAASQGYAVRVVAVTDPARLKGDAARAWQDYVASGGAPAGYEPESLAVADVVVDALLGTGLDRPLEGALAAAVESINASTAPVLALDIPTGLHADTGHVLGTAVSADVTVSFVGQKTGLFLGVAPDYCGVLEFADLGLTALGLDVGSPVLRRLPLERLAALLPPRARTAHKGANGRVLVIGGGPGMAGAIRMAGEAALRAGAGLVYVATRPENVVSIVAGRPELIVRGIGKPRDLDALMAEADVLVLGPGLGQSDWAESLWQRAVAHELPLVVDADALNILSRRETRREHWIITPHPGEAARLLGTTVAGIEADRLTAVKTLAERYSAVAVLKGARTLVADRDVPDVCDHGNPGMATAGMGDVLSGVLGGLIAQTANLTESARAGVLLHALAGDEAARAGGERGLIATDLMPYIRQWANPPRP